MGGAVARSSTPPATRAQRRRKRRNANGLPVISIVGYTNAGKSTLLNSLTESEVLVEDKLFATLDPTSRRLRFPRQREVIITDTVGFIRDLPHKLVEAFEATLQEAADADLLLHVIDAASPLLAEQQAEVDRVLEEIGAAGVPQLLVYNKCDLLEDSLQPREPIDSIEVHPGVRRPRVFVSARTGQGLVGLRAAIAQVVLDRLNAATAAPSVTLPDGSTPSPWPPAPEPAAIL